MTLSECKLDTFRGMIDQIIDAADQARKTPDGEDDRRMPCGVYVLDHRHILATPRDNGDSRYPYGQNGFNFWVYASGYMHSNEGLFSHFLRAASGQEPNVAFFAGLPGKQGGYTPIPLLSVPVLNNPQANRFDHITVLSSCAAYFIASSDDLRFAVRIFVSPAKEICFSVSVRNRSRQDRSLYLSSFFNPFLRHQVHDGTEDPWFKQTWVLDPPPSPTGLGSFLVRVNEDMNRTTSVSNWGVFRRSLILGPGSALIRHESTTARRQYVGGARHSLHTAASLTAGAFGSPQRVCTFIDQAIAGDMLHLKIPAGSDARLDIVFNHTNDEPGARRTAHEPLSPDKIDLALKSLEDDDRHRHDTLTLSIGKTNHKLIRPKVFNAFIEHLKRQVEFCSLIKGYVQLSENSLIGVRDVCQAIEALAAWRPRAARTKLIEVLGFTTPQGRCFRQYSLPPNNGHIGRMDLRPFIDSGAWVIACALSYLKLTGDYGFLNEKIGYHRIKDEALGIVEPASEKDTVLDHLFRIMDYLLDHRDHGHTDCVRALYGDWNDALDGLGISMDPAQTYGTGVSVMATLQVYHNCLDMIELLQVVDLERHAPQIRIYQRDAQAIQKGLQRYALVEDANGQKRILHGWGDRRSYLVGSFEDPDGMPRDGLTSNAFWVLSGMLEHDTQMSRIILDAFDRLDGKYGFKTFTPAFSPNVRGVGRIGKLPPGTAENGAAYIHATAFAIMALFQMGQPKRAWEQLIKILPFTDLHQNLSHSPFVMPNSYGHNPDIMIDGQNMNDWQTGSSNVVLKTLNRFVFGIEPTLHGLWVQPAGWAPFLGFKVKATVRGCDVRITCDTDAATGRRFIVNGKTMPATFDKTLGIDKLWLSPKYLVEKSLDIRITR